jgi:Glycosyl transferases group 1
MRILELHAPYFRDLWRRQGHEVIAWGPHAHCDLRPDRPATTLAGVLALLPAGWTPELILYGDDCRLPRVVGVEAAPCPTVMLSIDAHHNAGWQGPLAGAFDVACVGQQDFLPAFARPGGAGVHWLPCWAPDGLPPPAPEKAHAVAFVGALDPRLNPERVAFMEAFAARLPLHLASGAWIEVFGRSRIVLNQTVKGDLNARVFEAMAAGAFLLTERTGNGLLELFVEGEHLVTYPRGDVGAAVAAARRWLADEPGRAAIAARGAMLVRARHCESHRAAALLAHVAAAPAPLPAAFRLGAAARGYGMLAHYAGRLAAHFPDEPLYPPLRLAYLAAAATLAQDPDLDEPDRRATLGQVALEEGRGAEAIAHLDWVAERRGDLEDHVARLEALIRTGDVRRARDAAAALRAAHPGYPIGRQLEEGLGLLAGG